MELYVFKMDLRLLIRTNKYILWNKMKSSYINKYLFIIENLPMGIFLKNIPTLIVSGES